MSNYKSSKLLKKKRVRRYWRLALILSFLLVLLYGTSFWSSRESVNISGLEIKGNKYISNEIIENIFWNEVDGKYLFILSKKNFLFLPKQSIRAKLKRELSVKDVLISADPNEAVLEIIEHESTGEYCVEEKCFLINCDGLIFTESPLVLMDELVSYTGNLEGDILGQIYSDTDVYKKIFNTIELLKKINVSINSVSTEDFETFNLQSMEGPYLIIDKMDDPVSVVNNLKTTLEQETIHDVQFRNIDYIDLRFGNKVYYKIK